MKFGFFIRVSAAASCSFAFWSCLRLLVILPDAMGFLLKNAIFSPASRVSFLVMPLESFLVAESPAIFWIAFLGLNRVSIENMGLLLVGLIVLGCSGQIAFEIAHAYAVPLALPEDPPRARIIINTIEAACLWGVAIRKWQACKNAG